jgi:hypothetical protein
MYELYKDLQNSISIKDQYLNNLYTIKYLTSIDYDLFCELIEKNKYKIIKYILKNINLTFNINTIIMKSIKAKNSKIFILLYKKYYIQPWDKQYLNIKTIFRLRKHKIIKILLFDLYNSKYTNENRNNSVFRLAVKYNYIKVVRNILNNHITKIDPSSYDNGALKYAVKFNYYKITKMLLNNEKFNYKLNNKCIICTAIRYKRYKIIELFMNKEFIPKSDHSFIIENLYISH